MRHRNAGFLGARGGGVTSGMAELPSLILRWVWGLATAVQGVFQHTYTSAALATFWDLTSQLWYFVVVGALFSALAWCFLPRDRMREALARRTAGSVVVASLLGLVSPMCTFAAIPVVGALLKAGVPAPPLMAFLVASPLMNPSLFVYTYGALGMEMATARVLTALVMGLSAGLATRLVSRGGFLYIEALGSADDGVRYPVVAGGSGQLPEPVVWTSLVATTARRFAKDLAFISKYFALGIAVAALAKTLLSEELVRLAVGTGSAWSVPMAVALGVPLYACGGGSIPIVEIMMQMGMTSGAALAFFIAGPATKFSTLAVLGTVFGRRLLFCYLALMLSGALFWGLVYPFQRSELEVGAGADSAAPLLAP
ncbi:MAG: hypothetical protein CME15_03220 [Gemmatimonadetes bacterium]|nr:hypothetical protein [Gemmatimonadota bacterium]